MRRASCLFLTLYCALASWLAVASATDPISPAPISAEQSEFFENRIRSVLVDQCYKCHNSADKAEGSLALDSRDALLKGGDGGAIITPGKPTESRLLAILRHEVPDLKMPKNSGKLDPRVVADSEKWIAWGAPDPRDKPPSAEELAKATSWEATLEKRKRWWSFQPIRNVAPPELPDNRWSQHPVDRFVLAKLREKELQPGPPADARTLVRRLYFALIGLPPTPAEAQEWTARLTQPAGYEALVDHLLASPHFGERWARHWMDWLRYAESHGSEGDPAIDNAWQYRDYLIRALNTDVSYDQLVREHVAGDLLQQPRVNRELGINESLIGPAHWRMVFHGFAPVDPLEEKVRFVDDQINTFSKAFLGLTVSCARCHDHKFDPISQRDYYALFGILGSCRPSRVAINTPEILVANRDELAALKPKIQAALADDWLAATKQLHDRLLGDAPPWKQADKPDFALNVWFVQQQETMDKRAFDVAWQRRVSAWQADRERRAAESRVPGFKRWNLASAADYASWFRRGNTLPDKPSAAGEFAVAPKGEHALTGIYPAGAYSHRLSGKHPAGLSSADVHLDGDYELWLHVIGDGGASARYVVQNYPRDGVIYPVHRLLGEWHWKRIDLTYWNGEDLHLELTTGKDAPILVNGEPRSWFGIREALFTAKGAANPSEKSQELFDPLFLQAAESPPKSFEQLADVYVQTIAAAVTAWQAGKASDAQALLLDACLKQGLLPNRLDQLAAARPLLAEYQGLEEAIVVPTRVPGLEETLAHDQPLLDRGNHKKPGAIVPRHFLEAIDDKPYQTTQSGRRQLAEDVLRSDNPLTRRVIVNRLWHHLFGLGIVATPDNFGQLGLEPTHPELLDYLATRFGKNGGSLKDTIRLLVTSQTWQLTARPSAQAQRTDPDNQFLSHARVRRLEAEAIRDSLLAVSGGLSAEMFGPPATGQSSRRSIYVQVKRTALDPFLRGFDFPEPFATVGRRDATNVPAQSLMLLNDPWVAGLATNWAGRVLADDRHATPAQRIGGMFIAALGRPASSAEIQRFQEYLAELERDHVQRSRQIEQLTGQIAERQAAIRALLEPVRERLQAAAKTRHESAPPNGPTPIARWEFTADLQDVLGNMHGVAKGSAAINAGALAVGKQAYVVTAPLSQTIKEKTLEAWVQLDNLQQRGGGVITVQSANGSVFDAIVYAEKKSGQWLAGSNVFQRTRSFDGEAESEATQRPVHLAVAYHADGRIVGYRDGKPYGKAYQTGGPIEFKAGEAVVCFGLRHLPASDGKALSGRILRARLYDKALSDEEIAITAQASPNSVTESQILATLSEAERQQIAADRRRIAELETAAAVLGPMTDAKLEQTTWSDLARAMFLFKEFIYVD